MAKRSANGEGNIRKRSNGRWEGATPQATIPTPASASSKKLEQAMQTAEQLDMTRTDDYTVLSWLRTWFALYSKPNVRPNTAEYYRRSIELHNWKRRK